MIEKTAEATSTLDREIVDTRLLDAPRELVWEVWADPKHIARWWGPNGFTTSIRQMNVRPGGAWRLVMHGPDGTDYNNKIVFVEVVKPERIVFRHTPDPKTETVNHQTTVTFADGTKSMEQGFGGTWDQLAAYLAREIGSRR